MHYLSDMLLGEKLGYAASAVEFFQKQYPDKLLAFAYDIACKYVTYAKVLLISMMFIKC
jgi:hypothetical protein